MIPFSFYCSQPNLCLFLPSQVWHHLPRPHTKPVKRILSKHLSKPSCLHVPPRPWHAKEPGWVSWAPALWPRPQVPQAGAPPGRVLNRLSFTPNWAKQPPPSLTPSLNTQWGAALRSIAAPATLSGQRPVTTATMTIARQQLVIRRMGAQPLLPQPQLWKWHSPQVPLMLQCLLKAKWRAGMWNLRIQPCHRHLHHFLHHQLHLVFWLNSRILGLWMERRARFGG